MKNCNKNFGLAFFKKNVVSKSQTFAKIIADIKKMKVLVTVVGMITFLLFACGNKDEGTANWVYNRGDIEIEVKGVKHSRLHKSYIVEIIDDNAQHIAYKEFDENGKCKYPTVNMIEGSCYTFRILTKDKKSTNDRIKWDRFPKYCMDNPLTPPHIETITKTIDRDNNVYIVGVVLDSTANAKEFACMKGEYTNEDIDNLNLKWQSDTIFKIKGEDAVVTFFARNDVGQSTHQDFFEVITPLPKPLSKSEAQMIMDAVSNGQMSPSVAQDKLAGGNCNLKHAVDGDIKTLWGILMEADNGTKFRINSFVLDENTNKIKSGSLDIDLR